MFLRYTTILLLLSLFSPIHAQIATESVEPSSTYSLPQIIEAVKMPPVDVDKMKAEDEAEQIKGDKPPRFGKKMEVQLSPKTHGEFTMLPNGDRVWRIRVFSKDAYSINFLFDKFRLSPKSELFLYNEDKSYLIGAFTAINNKSDGMFATAPVKGDRVTLELYEPKDEIGQSIVSISHVVHAYKNLFKLENPIKGYGDSGSCNIDVACPESAGWEDQINSVAMIIVNGSRSCTGSMVNNTNQDGTPYFLSADHCGTGMNNNWVYVFDYQSPTCGGVDGDLSHSITGATLVSNYSPSDFTLAELSATPPPAYTVYFAGWDRTNDASPESTGIHHPAGDVMKISHNTDALYSGNWGSGSSNIPSGNHWIVDNWEEGTTEGGSSGSGLFNTEKRIVGQLHGGGASCSNITYDSYGKTFTSWTGGGTSTSRLSDHLDPNNSGVSFIDGTYITPSALDVSLSSINGIEQSGCSSELEVSVVISNNGSTTITSVELEYTLDGVMQDSSITGLSLATGGSVEIVLFDLVFTEGNHTLSATVSLPNGGQDENSANDTKNETWTVIDGELFTVEFLADDYPGESSFDIKDDQGNVVFFQGTITSGLNEFSYCLEPGCYTFTIYDSYGDGICCGYGNGSYTIYDGENNVIATGVEFDSEETTAFCYEQACPEIYFVNHEASGTSTGESWEDAFTTLAQAVASVPGGECTEVWVATGTYYLGDGERRTSFSFKNEVQYYGGFLAGMNEKSQRNMAANPVVLSGDINVKGDASDNAYSVVVFLETADETCVVDGFTIMDGNANGIVNGDDNGGGVKILGGSPTLKNLIITGNSCTGNGGGIFVDGGNPILENVNCTANTGESVFVLTGNVEYKGTNNID